MGKQRQSVGKTYIPSRYYKRGKCVFRGGSRNRVYIGIQFDTDGGRYTTTPMYHVYHDLIRDEFTPVLAVVVGQRAINYTFRCVRRDWYRVNLSWNARRWHLTRLNVLWICGDVSREECLRLATKT